MGPIRNAQISCALTL